MLTQMHNFIKILRAATINDILPLETPDWDAIYQIAEAQSMTPLFAEGASKYPEYKETPDEFRRQVRVRSFVMISAQAQKSADFLSAYDALLKAGLRPLVVKGLICRLSYGELADHRSSADEDIYIPMSDFDKCREVLQGLGFTMNDEYPGEKHLDKVRVFTFLSPDIKIEVHLSLFGNNTEKMRICSSYFDDAFDNAATVSVDGIDKTHTVYTLDPTQHYLFLFLHLYKHFTGSGVGIRQISDVVLFYDMFHDKINLSEVESILSEIRAEKLYADVLAIGKMIGISVPTELPPVDPDALLEEIFNSGVFGGKDANRRLSGYIVGAAVNGEKFSSFKKLFPSLSALSRDYPVLFGKPWLYPAVWGKRLIRYTKKGHTISTEIESIAVAEERLKLMKKYDMVD